jgi:hypothetical protein
MGVAGSPVTPPFLLNNKTQQGIVIDRDTSVTNITQQYVGETPFSPPYI